MSGGSGNAVGRTGIERSPARWSLTEDSEPVPVSRLRPSDSPRRGGEDADHVRAMLLTGRELPPIVVHRESMRVVDGMHRLRARIGRGETTVRARYLSGSASEAFLYAVEANVGAGLPLSRAERRAAARRIVVEFPEMSDRTLARTTGLAQQTVARIRREVPRARAGSRIGRDGRVRPMDPCANRRVAQEYLREHPDASLREIARAAGISPSTAQDVRRRAAAAETTRSGGAEPAVVEAGPSPLDLLLGDPAVRQTETGRMFVRWLRLTAAVGRHHRTIAHRLPEHGAAAAARAVRLCLADMEEFARCLEGTRT